MPNLILGKSHLDNALYLAHAANAAYYDNPREQYPTLSQMGLDTLLLFASRPSLDTFGFVAANANHLVLAFRGTDDPLDWMTNLRVRMVDWDQGQVHKGFARSLDSVWSQVDQYVGQLYQSQRIWVCGHSLGGALATLASQRLRGKQKPEATYTFAQPRVGDATFQKRFKGVLKRFVNNRDIAPHLPPRTISGYQHVGDLQFLDADGQLQDEQDASSLVDLDLALQLVTVAVPGVSRRLVTRFLESRLEDHKLDNYIARIEALL